MKKGFLLVLLMVFLAWGTAYAQYLDVDLSCPSWIGYGSGDTQLKVTAYIENWDCQDVTVQRYMSGLIANPSNSLGNIAVYGPFPRFTTNPITVPASDCQGTPGTYTLQNIFVMKVPNVPGKMGMVYVSFITPDGKEVAGGDCLINIGP